MFGSGKKVTISDVLYKKLTIASGILGCSLEDLIEKTLEKEAERVMSQTSNREPSESDVEEIANQLKGLGYLE